MSAGAVLEPWIAHFLTRVGIEAPNPDVAIHRRIVQALRDVGPARHLGAQLAAVRYVVRDEHAKAGKRLAAARADHEDTVRDEKIRLLQGEERVSVALAKELAEQKAKAHRREWLVAEQEERTLREFLKAIADDLENHRTDRADLRVGDRAESSGMGGGA